MGVKEVLRELNFSVSKEELKELKKEIDIFTALTEKVLRKLRIDAELFVGGSYAKKTLARSDNYDVAALRCREHHTPQRSESAYDIDVFVRFDWKYENLSADLEKVVKEVSKAMRIGYVKIHGSRDYFRIEKSLDFRTFRCSRCQIHERHLDIMKGTKITFEIIPVLRIKKVNEERNVTDLSYFHVNYVKKNINEKISKDISTAKRFCIAQRVYGAESYVNGFSGYALECLIIYYKSFEKTLKELVKVKKTERLILDPAKFYKKRENVLFELNESRLGSPIILVDPTWKERNILAALSRETFEKFQEKAKEFLANPGMKFFDIDEFDMESMKERARKRNAEFLHIVLKTDRQEGDIAGTKMKKFANFLKAELWEYFEVIESEFDYRGGEKADFYLIVRGRKEVLKLGPPIKKSENAKAFKQANKDVFEKNGMLNARIKVDFSARKFLDRFKEKYSVKIKEMDITDFEIKD